MAQGQPRADRGYDADFVSIKTATVMNPELDKAQQSFAEETNINTIVRRFGLTGQMPAARSAPEYGDFTGVSDFQSALNALMDADEAFMEMPATLRERFKNDPGRFLEFIQDKSNEDEARELGILPKKAAAGPQEPRGEAGAPGEAAGGGEQA